MSRIKAREMYRVKDLENTMDEKGKLHRSNNISSDILEVEGEATEIWDKNKEKSNIRYKIVWQQE